MTKVVVGDIIEFRRKILKWYDRNKRILPWRALEGQTPDPYKVWLSEIMLQQTTVPAVIPYFLKFTEKWPTVYKLAQADQQEIMNEWAGLGYYARARNLHKCANVIVADHNGKFPTEEYKLRKLPGIGDYTSAAIASIAFDKPATVVDGNVERVMARYFAVYEPLPAAKKQLRQYAHMLSEGRSERPGDYAQALMDLGAGICTPKSPVCALCPLSGDCKAYSLDKSDIFPFREKKGKKPQKTGKVYRIMDGEGRILVQKRPETGLLGGMYGLPTSDWVLSKNRDKATSLPFLKTSSAKILQVANVTVRHSFTHFDLELYLCHVQIANFLLLPSGYEWMSEEEILNISFPTVFKKAYKLFCGDKETVFV